jgi:NaMN:DMB phosphoribosyltransferase
MAAPFGPRFALSAALLAALGGGLPGGVGFSERVSDGPNCDIVKVERVAVSGFQRFNRGHVPLGDFQEKLGGVGGIVHLGLLAVASGCLPAPEGPFAL